MDMRKLDGDLSVGPQITLDDVARIAEAGFKTLVCNRPDGEDAAQVPFDSVAAEAERLGMKAVYLPVTNQTMGPMIAEEFHEVLASSDQPVFAYCRSGTRCTILWSIGELMHGRSPNEVVVAAGRAGYDVSGLAANFSPAS